MVIKRRATDLAAWLLRQRVLGEPVLMARKPCDIGFQQAAVPPGRDVFCDRARHPGTRRRRAVVMAARRGKIANARSVMVEHIRFRRTERHVPRIHSVSLIPARPVIWAASATLRIHLLSDENGYLHWP